MERAGTSNASGARPKAGGEVRRTGIPWEGRPVERRERHHAPRRVREEQAFPSERVLRVLPLPHPPRELEHARPPDPGQDTEIEGRRAQPVAVPPAHGPHRPARPAVADLDPEDRVARTGERPHQRGDILRRLGQAELAERATETGQMPLEERDTPVAHAHGFDETVALHGSSPVFTGSSTRSLHSVNDPSYTRTRG